MKRAHMVAGIMLLLLSYPCTVSAQGRHQWPGKSSSVVFGGISPERLDLSEEQRVIVRKIEQTYHDQINALQGKLISKRLELQSVFRDPQAEEGMIRAKAREVFDLEHQCESLTMDYQIQIRGILTAEQLRNWCSAGDRCFPWKQRKQQ